MACAIIVVKLFIGLISCLCLLTLILKIWPFFSVRMRLHKIIYTMVGEEIWSLYCAQASIPFDLFHRLEEYLSTLYKHNYINLPSAGTDKKEANSYDPLTFKF